MRRYETIAILDPDLSEEGRAPVFDRLTELIPAQNGFLVKLDQWGNRRLAYDIKKKSRGFYICVDLCGDGALVNEMERFFRIDDRVLKYMTVVLNKDVDLEAVKAEIAEAEAEAKAKAEADAEAAGCRSQGRSRSRKLRQPQQKQKGQSRSRSCCWQSCKLKLKRPLKRRLRLKPIQQKHQTPRLSKRPPPQPKARNRSR